MSRTKKRIKAPKDILEVLAEGIRKIHESGKEAEYAGKLTSLTNCYLKCYKIVQAEMPIKHIVSIELEKPADISDYLRGDKIIEEERRIQSNMPTALASQ